MKIIRTYTLKSTKDKQYPIDIRDLPEPKAIGPMCEDNGIIFNKLEQEHGDDLDEIMIGVTRDTQLTDLADIQLKPPIPTVPTVRKFEYIDEYIDPTN
jgi:hypothetical protein